MECTIYLFSSRARNEARRSSDFDIGIEGLDATSFSYVKREMEDWIEESPIPIRLMWSIFPVLTQILYRMQKKEL